jgi:hypothetical protein
MQVTIVRYKVKADKAEENKAFIRRVFDEPESGKPEGLRYVSLAEIVESYRLFWQKMSIGA